MPVADSGDLAWFPPAFVAEIDMYYRVQSVVKKPLVMNHAETGRYVPLIGDCRIMVPREADDVKAR
jgi:hypothetical protein